MLDYLTFLPPLAVAAITAATRRPVIGTCADQASVERSWRVQSVMAPLLPVWMIGTLSYAAYATPNPAPPLQLGHAGIPLLIAAITGLPLMLVGIRWCLHR